jgi:polyferredoxin
VSAETRLPPFETLAREARATIAIDREWSTEVLKGPDLRARASRIKRLRWMSQAFWMAVVLFVGTQFVLWVRAIEMGYVVYARPPGVEGFLPLSAMLSLRHFFASGAVHGVRPAGFVIFLLIVASGLLLKKAFCSWFCPIGTLSELLAAASRRLFRRKMALPRLLDLPLRSLKYLLLLFFASAIFVRMSPDEVAAFLDSPYNRVADVRMLYFFERISPFALGVVAALVVLSFVVPYFWCRYLCPYGGLLGFLSLLSPLKVARHAPSCIDCSLCSKACPAHLPVERLGRVRSDECFGCLSCVAACPVPRALRVEAPLPWSRAVRPAAFALLVFVLFVGGILAAKSAGVWRTSVSDEEYASRLKQLDRPEYNHPR